MLYVFYGNNTTKVADRANRLVGMLLGKRPDAEMFSFDGDEMEEAVVDALIEARGLFSEKHIVVLKRTFENPVSKDLVLDRLERFSGTENIFVLVEGKLGAPERKKLEEFAEKIEEHTEEVNVKTPFNVFALGDALGKRNRKDMWVKYIQSLRAGNETESVHGTLCWAVRSMLLAQSSGTAKEAGLKPFVYSKFKRYAENFSRNELITASGELVELYHEARRGKHELKTALEKWILASR